jgi:hypothetical protein
VILSRDFSAGLSLLLSETQLAVPIHFLRVQEICHDDFDEFTDAILREG